MEEIKFKAICKKLDGGTEESEVTLNQNMTFENSSTPGGAPDAFRQTEIEEITSYDDIKPYIIEEYDNSIYCDFKGKVVHLSIEATEENWALNIYDLPKTLYIVGMMYNPDNVSNSDLNTYLSIGGHGYIFGTSYASPTSLVVIEFDPSLQSNIVVMDRFVSYGLDY